MAVSACGVAQVDTPRLATQAAIIEATATSSPPRFLITAPASSPSNIGPAELPEQLESETASSIIVWVNETNAEHVVVLDKMVFEFTKESGIDVEIAMISNDDLPELVQTGVISGTLPDIIFHPSEYSFGWVKQGILDPIPATKSIEILGSDTFDSEVLEQFRISSEDDIFAAIPSDLWRLLVLYRKDWFEELGLQPPQDYQSVLEASEALFLAEENRYGLIIPTDAALPSTQRLFEFIALANGCQLVDSQGEVTFVHPACLESLEYYRSLINEFSPIGVQTEISALNAYLASRTGLIMASSGVLPAIAGYVDEYPPECSECSETQFLVQNSGQILDFTGSGEYSDPVSLSAVTALGITADADQRASIEFINYWLDDGYEKWISANPERKIPVRHSSLDQPQRFIDSWKQLPMGENLPSLQEVFGSELVDTLVNGTGNNDRWGASVKQGEVMTTMYEELVISPLLQEMLSGYFSSSQTVIEIYNAIIEALPDYQFPILIQPDLETTP
jgi:multiple sugar transport system substrate-binding protein